MNRAHTTLIAALMVTAGALIPSLGVAASSLVIEGAKVRDAKTGLVWQQTSSATMFTWAEAKAYCAGLALDGGGWRLPNVRELQSIVDDTVTKNTGICIDAKVFAWVGSGDNIPLLDDWSSTQVAGSSSAAWHVSFLYGSAFPEDVTLKHYVRCVR